VPPPTSPYLAPCIHYISAEKLANKGMQTGNAGKWKTTHHESKISGLRDGQVHPGDMGMWVSCARSQENKAAREVVDLLEEVPSDLLDPLLGKGDMFG
jgi:hypothetical protein